VVDKIEIASKVSADKELIAREVLEDREAILADNSTV
jgi:hypothetical protein